MRLRRENQIILEYRDLAQRFKGLFQFLRKQSITLIPGRIVLHQIVDEPCQFAKHATDLSRHPREDFAQTKHLAVGDREVVTVGGTNCC
jgi:hypothetical protein